MHNAKPLFIVGVGRSGTSLLQSIVGTHSLIDVVPETSFLRRYALNSKIDWNGIKDDEMLSRQPKLKSALLACKNDRMALIAAYEDTLLNNQYHYVLDKDPRLIEFIPLLKQMNSECKIIEIRRDPRDVLASKKKASWSKGRSIISYLMASFIQLSDGKKHRGGDNVYSLDYEALLKSPEQEIKAICRFLELEFEINMMEFQSTAKKLVQSEELSWKKETLQPINNSNMGKWKSSLSDLEAHSSVLVACNADPTLAVKNKTAQNVYTWARSIVLLFGIKLLAIPYNLLRFKKYSAVYRELKRR